MIGVDQPGNRCWVRRWPLARHGSPVFELPLGQVQEALPHRPLPVGGAWADERGLGLAGAVKRSTTDPVGAVGSLMVISFGCIELRYPSRR